MTPKIARFLRDNAPPTPCLVLDVDRVEEKYRAMHAALPLTRIYYAVKANPAAPILERLVKLGSSFDAASFEEVQACLDAGARPEAISYGNTIKKASAIAAAHKAGVSMFAFDSIEELEKLARHAPGARVYCRILVQNEGAEWPLSRKFGCELDMARDLMLKAGDMGLDPYGISFHVGSQQTKTAAYEGAIARVAMLFTDLKEAGVKLRMVNLGGGYPVRWVYLDIGRFGGLAETEGEAIRYDIRTPHDGSEDGPVTIAGPTCDSTDTLYEKSNYRMPLNLACGDRVELLSTGAYVTTYASQGFNGYAPLKEHYI